MTELNIVNSDLNTSAVESLSIFPDVYYSRCEAAKRLGIAPITLDRYAGRKFPKYFAGPRRPRFKGSDLIAWLRGEGSGNINLKIKEK